MEELIEVLEVLGQDKKGRPIVKGSFVDIEVAKIGRRMRKSRRLSGIAIGSWEGKLVVMTGKGGRGASCFCRFSKARVVRDPEVE